MQIYKNMVILASAGNLTPYVHPTTHSPSIIQQDASNRFVTDVQISAWDSGTGGASYTHPTTHSPSIIQQDASNRFVSDTEKTTWNNKGDPYTHPTTHSPSIIQQDASNRFVTDVEKALWNSGTEGPAGTNGSDGILNSIGGTQTWQDVKASRLRNVTYQNTTGKPIIVSVTVTSDTLPDQSNYGVGMSINGFPFSYASDRSMSAYIEYVTNSIVVPDNQFYMVTGDGLVWYWSEFR